MSAPLSLYISPKVSFMSNIPGTSKVINLLVLIHVLQFRWANQTGPKAVPGATLAESEAGDLESVDHTIVCMCRIIDFES
jgi:hypothetical protein